MYMLDAQILPSRDITTNEGKVIPLSDPDYLSNMYDDLKSFVTDMKRVPVLKEHNRNGESYGLVTDIFQKPSGLVARMKVTKQTYLDYMAGKIRFVSPSLEWQFKSDNGKTYRTALPEVSLVSVPRYLDGQPTLQEMNGTNFSQPATFKWITEPTDLAEDNVGETIVKEDNSNTQEVDEMNMEELKAFIADSLNAMKESLKTEILDSLKAMEEAEVEEPEEEVAVEETAMASEDETLAPVDAPAEPEATIPANDEVAMLKAQLADLMAEKEEMACKTKLSEDTAGITLIDEDKGMLEKVMKLDPEVYRWMLTKLEELAKAGATTEEEADYKAEKTDMSQKFKGRIAVASQSTGSPKGLMERAKELSDKEKISFAEAVNRLKG